MKEPLAAERLRTLCDPQQFDFETTDEVEMAEETLGQERVLEALQFGTGIDATGFNLYVLGSPESDRHAVVEQFLKEKAADRQAPDDWCYVHNFKDHRKPVVLRLPAGTGSRLRHDMRELVEDLQVAIPASFETDEYRARRSEIEQDVREQQTRGFNELQQEAESKGMGILQTPQGFAVAPVKEGKVISQQDFEKLPEEERKEAEAAMSELSVRLRKHLEGFPKWLKAARDRARELDREIARATITPLLDALKERYTTFAAVGDYLSDVLEDLVHNVKDFRQSDETPMMPMLRAEAPDLTRYQVNLLVDNSGREGAPIVYESSPSHMNLVGRVEHLSSFGALMTDFTLLKPGSLHRANGGFLVLDIDRLLSHPFAWQSLKQALQAEEIRLESLERVWSVVSTVSLEPEPIPLKIKVILIGSRLFYHLLSELDDDFRKLFKVAADFEEEIDRSSENVSSYGRLIARLIHRDELKPFNRAAVARVVERLSRQVSDAEKLSTHQSSLADLLREADYWCGQNGSTLVTEKEVQQAIDSQLRRLDRVHSKIQEAIQRKLILIDTAGEAVGQVNGLSVFGFGGQMFGQPSRITATARLGKGDVVDIEREVDLGGSLHSKGVLILSSFLASRFAPEAPLSVSASLVFEQSYGGVDGDSATVAEICALLSAISSIPIRQSFAVTGSMDQHGRVQAIGGVNEKIEGFFDICQSRGLTGDQGVLIPEENVQHLMLRHDVVEAARRGDFKIYSVSSVEEAVALLTGLETGERDEEGNFPEESVFGRVEARLIEMAELGKEAKQPPRTDDDCDSTSAAESGEAVSDGGSDP